MEISVKEYCQKHNKNERYIQKLLKENRLDLLKNIKSFRKIGYYYFIKESTKKTA